MEKTHKKWLWGSVSVLTLALAIVLTLFFWPEKAVKTPVKGKVAVVNGVEITLESFNHELRPLLMEISEQENKPTNPQLLNIKKNVLERMIVNELLYQESMKEGIGVEDSAVKDRIEQIKKHYPEASDFEKELAAMGMTEEDAARQIRKEMTIQKYVYKKFVENVTVTDKEVDNYYKKYGKNQIRQDLKQVKARQELNAYVEKLKADADIKSYLKIKE